MSSQFDPIDARLLSALQAEIPLVERPFAQIARQLELSEDEVMRRCIDLRGPRKVIRQISAIFDSRALGYAGALVASQVEEGRIDEAAAIISAHPGVSHNYRRNHAYNLWYTLAVPPDSRFGLEGTVDLLHRQSGARVTRLMPSLRMYKIGVRFDVSGEGNEAAPAAAIGAAQPPRSLAIGPAEQRMIRVLQQDLPLVARPFDAWAHQAETDVPALLAAAEQFGAQGAMRRFSAVLHHRRAGFTANAMGAWVVGEADADRFGAIAAGFPAVSHCYRRPTYPDWPYSLFTMVHGTSTEACEQVLSEISAATGVTQYAALYSTHEYKKVRLRYFTGDIEAWESAVT